MCLQEILLNFGCWTYFHRYLYLKWCFIFHSFLWKYCEYGIRMEEKKNVEHANYQDILYLFLQLQLGSYMNSTVMWLQIKKKRNKTKESNTNRTNLWKFFFLSRWIQERKKESIKRKISKMKNFLALRMIVMFSIIVMTCFLFYRVLFRFCVPFHFMILRRKPYAK